MPAVYPDSVLVSGPEKTVNGIDVVYTEELEYKDIRTGIEDEIPLQQFDEALQITMSRQQVLFRAEIQKIIELTLKEIEVIVENSPRSMLVTPLPSTLSLTVVGGEKLLLGIKPKDILAVINYSDGAIDESHGYIPRIEVPDGIEFRDIRPSEFKLKMERAHASARD